MPKLSNDEGTRDDSELDSLAYRERRGFSPLISESFFFPIPIPILFMYGDNKYAMQHSPQWCEYITSVKRVEDGISNVIKIEGGGHWFFAEPNCSREVSKHVVDFIKAPTK
ncbi:unnamed protein product [Phytomonas sp. Hart1]|nr:unnamed protein product [Phytomonas sp. Hart1]|eukprot:CCW69898.1 unnamed protein product [Phytomonas sp. isolate Hart1]